MIGLQALTLALQARAIPPMPVLFRLPGLPAMVRALYEAAVGFIEVRTLPWADEAPGAPPEVASGFERVVDLRDFAFDPGFRGVAMIDYFLRHLGLDPDPVPPSRKRNAWLAAMVRPRPPRDAAPGYVLVCPFASMDLRRMPRSIHEAILAWFTARGRPVLTQASRPAEPTLEDLCGLVASASLVVSTDTAMVHLADAFSVPCLAFFTTHRPEWRVRDYPLCRAVHLPVAGLPPALEFSRGEADLAASRAAWFPHGDDLAWLTDALGLAEAAVGSLPGVR